MAFPGAGCSGPEVALSRLSTVVLVLLIAWMSFAARAGAQSIKIVGVGASSCAQFLKDIEAGPQIERGYFAWAQGYMSGLLIRAPAGKDEDLDLTPPAFPLKKQANFLRSYCLRNSGDDFSDAVNMLYRTLRAPSG